MLKCNLIIVHILMLGTCTSFKFYRVIDGHNLKPTIESYYIFVNSTVGMLYINNHDLKYPALQRCLIQHSIPNPCNTLHPNTSFLEGRNDNNLNNGRIFIYRNIKYILALEKLLALRCFCNDMMRLIKLTETVLAS